MKAMIYEGPVRFSKFYMSSIFGDDIEITEEVFDNLVVKYRSLYRREYIPGGQKFVEIDNPTEYIIRLY